MSYHNWNQVTLAALRKNVSRFIRTDSNGENVYLTIALATPDNGYGESLKERRESSYVVTGDGTHNIENISDTATIAFDVKIETIGTSEFTNNVLKSANGVQRTSESRFTVYVGADSAENIEAIVGWQTHMNYAPAMTGDSGNVAYMIASHIKFAQKDKARQQWVKRNGEFVDKR